MTTSDETRRSQSEAARRRAASRDLAPGMLLLVASQGSLIALDPDASTSGWHLAWALSPLVGIALLVWAQLRMLARSDERERAVELSAMAIGFGVVIISLAVLGVLQSADIGDLRQQVQLVTMVGVGAWAIASTALRRGPA